MLHTLRQIPEACTRIEGRFTGEAAQPYAMNLVRTSSVCQARAMFMDYDKVQPSEVKGWKLNDIIKVPSASCAGQQAVVQVWRKPAGQALKLDGQERARLYLQDAKAQGPGRQAGRAAGLRGQAGDRGQALPVSAMLWPPPGMRGLSLPGGQFLLHRHVLEFHVLGRPSRP